jgi:hypothetical protein
LRFGSAEIAQVSTVAKIPYVEHVADNFHFSGGHNFDGDWQARIRKKSMRRWQPQRKSLIVVRKVLVMGPAMLNQKTVETVLGPGMALSPG